MRSRRRIQTPTQPATVGTGRKLNASLDCIVGPTVGEINVGVALERISSALQYSSGDRPIARSRKPGRQRAGVACPSEVVIEPDRMGGRNGNSHGLTLGQSIVYFVGEAVAPAETVSGCVA